jgi:hypothetical protein
MKINKIDFLSNDQSSGPLPFSSNPHINNYHKQKVILKKFKVRNRRSFAKKGSEEIRATTKFVNSVATWLQAGVYSSAGARHRKSSKVASFRSRPPFRFDRVHKKRTASPRGLKEGVAKLERLLGRWSELPNFTREVLSQI